jgi:hypothetical protein
LKPALEESLPARLFAHVPILVGCFSLRREISWLHLADNSLNCLGIMASEDRKNEAPLANKPTASDGNKADILASENVDPVLNAKMRLINDVFPTRRSSTLW